MKRLHCPICNATEVYPITGGCTGWVYRCKSCGYRGALVVEYESEDEGRDKQ